MKLWRKGLSIPAFLSYGYCKRPWYRGWGRIVIESRYIRSSQG